MKETIRNRIDKVFSGQVDPVFRDQYLPSLRTNLATAEVKAHRQFHLILILVFVAELLRNASITEIAIAGVKVSDLTLVRKAMPIGIAYLSYQCTAMFSMRRLYREAHDEMVRNLHNGFYDQNLGHFFHSPSAFLAENIISVGSKARVGTLITTLSFPLKTVILFAPVLYGVRYFVYLFQNFGITAILVWVSLALSVMFFALAILIFWNTSNFTNE